MDSEIIKEMPSLKECKLLVLLKNSQLIVGAAGIGKFLNISALQITKDYQRRGIGYFVYKELIETLRKSGYSYITCYVDDKNTESIQMHEYFHFKTLFKIHLSKEKTQEIKILVLSKKGRFIDLFLKLFNSRLSQLILISFVKYIIKIKPQILGQSFRDDSVNISIKYVLKNFEKI